MLATVLIVLTVVVAALVAFVAMQPGRFRIERSATIDGPPAAVFPHINDFRQWPAWSPWEKQDPDMRRTYDGPASGLGSAYSWAGNKNVGEGRATIVESRPKELVRLKLEFLKPFVATNEATFTLEPLGEKTRVTWAMTGPRNFMFKLMHLIMNIDKMCGAQFEEGLASLNVVVKDEQASVLQHA